MAEFAPPVRRGDFVYSSVLYADPGGNHHTCANVAELAALLRPEAPNLYNNGKKPEVTTPVKDQVWHFYAAQLIHYGLPVTKDKNAAKVRLLNAMNQFKLEGKKATKSSTVGSSSMGSSHGVTGGVNVSVNLTLNSGGSPYSQYMYTQRASQNTPDNDATEVSTVKKESRVSTPSSTPSRSRVKQEQYDLTPMRSSPYIKSDPHQNHYQPESSLLLSGTYSIDCASASSVFDDYNLDLTLACDSSRGLWWATFHWGAWDGIIQMNPGPSDSNSLGLPCSLGWRLRDLNTGKLTFGRKCTGMMTFFRDGMVNGCLYEVPGVGDLVFEGTRMVGGNLQDDLKEEWDGFVTEAYRRRALGGLDERRRMASDS
ncbi:hypothetical protein AG0111_0g11512 [Alternaria gaisen]|uniref:Uncharacterized protein n=1 Tax=Alternaria gaisen TaxID=167740 RepID=A0ACB6F7H9_9PLEO|nr:hypothetical protein AG0111_0g11512 [Alternaria gaisen]